MLSIIVSCLCIAATSVDFVADAVWPANREKEMNCQVIFRGVFEWEGGNVILRYAGSSLVRTRVNGRFAAYGPARGPKGAGRIDEVCLNPYLNRGTNVIEMEVAGYYCGSFYTMRKPSYLKAQVDVDGKTVLLTSADKTDRGVFTAIQEPSRIQKVARYSFQRPFAECYRIPAKCGEELALVRQKPERLYPRRAPLPEYRIDNSFRPYRREKIRYDGQKKTTVDRSVACAGGEWEGNTVHGFAANELEVNPQDIRQRLVITNVEPFAAAAEYKLHGDMALVFENRKINTGFPIVKLKVTKPGRLMLWFEEMPDRAESYWNAVIWDITKPGEYDLEAFEAYLVRYFRIYFQGGEGLLIGEPRLREYKNPEVYRTKFHCSDDTLNKIFAAAVESASQNAVDTPTDCPGRERCAWFTDCLFTGRTVTFLSGNTNLETDFYECLAIADDFPGLPKGCLPAMCPGDYLTKGNFTTDAAWIPKRIEELVDLTGDRYLADKLETRIRDYLAFLNRCRNKEGFFENLPGDCFLEYSRTGWFPKDVNFPTQMVIANAFACAGRLYGDKGYLSEAEDIRNKMRTEHRSGVFFMDHMVRRNGKLCFQPHITEGCQAFALFFQTATPENEPEFWRVMTTEFGPERSKKGLYPEIPETAPWRGWVFRLDSLVRYGLLTQALLETKNRFAYQCGVSGALWESERPDMCMCHGYPSYVAKVIIESSFGFDVNYAKRSLYFDPPADTPLESADAEVATPDGPIRIGFRKRDGRVDKYLSMPAGWHEE